MVTLRKISEKDRLMLSERFHMSSDAAKRLIDQSDASLFQDRFFELYVISVGGISVGAISLFAHSSSVVSIGPEVFEEHRRHGYATAAMKMAMKLACEKGYTRIRQQIRVNNLASIKLHTRLGFETDGQIYKNRNQNEVLIYWKSL